MGYYTLHILFFVILLLVYIALIDTQSALLVFYTVLQEVPWY